MKASDIKPKVQQLVESLKKKLKGEKDKGKKHYLKILKDEFSELDRKL